jgi:nitrate reductase assembly molybdenum cofactor insertion protein NarJ
MRQLQNQTASLEYENKDLSEKKHRYEAVIQTLTEEKRLQAEELARIRKDLEIHKEKTNFLGAGSVDKVDF